MTTQVQTRQQADGGHRQLRHELLQRRYLRKDADGRVVETPDEMFRRVACAIAMPERLYGASAADVAVLADKFCELMQAGTFLPNSPTLMNAGRPDGMLSACFVIPVADSLDGIFRAIHQTAMVQNAGGGTGFAFDNLRPAGDLVASSGGTTSGPMSFMKVFGEATAAIQQGAMRRGANMGMMSIEHPDILKFITVKQDLSTLPNFNLSVKVTDDFMDRLAGEPDSPHIVVNPRTGKRYALPKGIALATYALQDLVPATQGGEDCCTLEDVWDMVGKSAWADALQGGRRRWRGAADTAKQAPCDLWTDLQVPHGMWHAVRHGQPRRGWPLRGFREPGQGRRLSVSERGNVSRPVSGAPLGHRTRRPDRAAERHPVPFDLRGQEGQQGHRSYVLPGRDRPGH